MTRSDLVKRLVQAAGAPESQGRVLMESFLTRLDSLLPDSSAGFSINGLGTFKKSADETIVSPDEISIEFHPAPQIGSEVLYFDLPQRHEPVDDLSKFFNPGIGKPVIPLKIEQSYEDYLYFAGTGLEQIVEAKVDKLVKTGKLHEEEISWSTPQLPVQEPAFQWTTESTAFQKELNNFKPEVKPEAPAEKPFNPRLTQETILPQDQQKGWKEELVEEEILNTGGNSERPVMEIEDDISWDFGSTLSEEEKRLAKLADTTPKKVPVPEKPAEDTRKKTGIDLLPIGDSTKEFSIDLSEFDEDGAQTGETETNPLDDSEIEDFDMFFKKSLARNVLDTVSFEQHENESVSKDIINPFPDELAPGHDEINLDELEEEEDTSDLPEVRAQKLTGFRKAEDEEDSPYVIPERPKVPEKVGWGRYSLTASFITVVGLASYIYMYGFPQWVKEYAGTLMLEKKRVVPTVIERDYLFPVSYPYEKAEGSGEELKLPQAERPAQNSTQEKTQPEKKTEVKKDEPVDVAKNEKPVNNAIIKNPISEALKKQTPPVAKEDKKAKQETKPVAQPKKPEENKPVKDNSKQLKSNIFQSGNTYVVQVMSSPKQGDSEREVARLKSKGYNAFLTEADIPGKGHYYRVRVGGFNSLAEAEKFAASLK